VRATLRTGCCVDVRHAAHNELALTAERAVRAIDAILDGGMLGESCLEAESAGHEKSVCGLS